MKSPTFAYIKNIAKTDNAIICYYTKVNWLELSLWSYILDKVNFSVYELFYKDLIYSWTIKIFYVKYIGLHITY